MDSIVHIENYKFTGRTTFRGGLLNNIVALSVQEVKGVSKMQGSHGKGVLRPKKGVKVTFVNDGTMIIDVRVWLEPGYSVADVSYRIQENVIAAASSILEKKVKAVNVKIINVEMPVLEGGQLVNKLI